MENEIAVSIICLAYNHEKYIRRALEGFVMQKTDFKFEVIVHDDASTDSTASIIREYELKYPELIKPIYQCENQYSKGVKNITSDIAFPASKGKYIAVCEGDDYWTDPYKLQKQFDGMEQHPDCSFCCHRTECVFEDGTPAEKQFPGRSIKMGGKRGRVLSKKEIISLCFVKDIYPFHTSSYFLSRKVLDKLREEKPTYKDYLPGDKTWLLTAINEGLIFYIDEVMSAYRFGAINGVNYTLRHQTKEYRCNYLGREIEGYSLYNDFTSHVYEKYIQVALAGCCLSIAPYDVEKYRKLLCSYRASVFFRLSTMLKGKYILLRFFPGTFMKLYRKGVIRAHSEG